MGLLEKLREAFRYEPETGRLFWIKSARPGFVGREARSPKDGYLEVRFGGSALRVHRVAYMLMTGKEIPVGKLIDHANGDRADNRWSNLRLATRSQNNHNRHRVRRDSKSGVRGVKYRADRDRFVPILRVDGRERKFGSFKTLEEAAARFAEVERKYRGENASCLF